jgi:hypothetical protein
LVLLVLAIVWAAVLASWLRSRATRTFGDSVGTFRRHLSVLERAAPVRVQPANTMHGPAVVPIPPHRRPVVAGASVAPAWAQGIGGATAGGSGAAPAPRLGPVAEMGAAISADPGRRPPTAATPPAPAATPRRAQATSAASGRRRRSLRRRRQVLTFLAATAVGTLVMGAVPGAHEVLYANVVLDLLLVSYIALLIRIRNIRAERDLKLSFLPPVRPMPAGMILRGTGRYAPLRSAMDTGEVLLQRAAN